jgi:hypothetical protein
MPFVVDVCVVFHARQGLPSPVRAVAGPQRLVPGEHVEVALRVGIGFEDGDLTERGWFFDTDALSARLTGWAGVPPSWNSRTGRTAAERVISPASDPGW